MKLFPSLFLCLLLLLCGGLFGYWLFYLFGHLGLQVECVNALQLLCQAIRDHLMLGYLALALEHWRLYGYLVHLAALEISINLHDDPLKVVSVT